jgi:hypothetical protein
MEGRDIWPEIESQEKETSELAGPQKNLMATIIVFEVVSIRHMHILSKNVYNRLHTART